MIVFIVCDNWRVRKVGYVYGLHVGKWCNIGRGGMWQCSLLVLVAWALRVK